MPCEQWQGGLKTANNLTAYTRLLSFLTLRFAAFFRRSASSPLVEIVRLWIIYLT